MKIEVGTKIAIVGSRDYLKLFKVKKLMRRLPKDCVVVSGGARGVDQLAETIAKERGLETLIFKAEWNKYGKVAGMKRNEDIVKAADLVVAFWNGFSSGTEHSIYLAKKLNKEVIIIK